MYIYIYTYMSIASQQVLPRSKASTHSLAASLY